MRFNTAGLLAHLGTALLLASALLSALGYGVASYLEAAFGYGTNAYFSSPLDLVNLGAKAILGWFYVLVSADFWLRLWWPVLVLLLVACASALTAGGLHHVLARKPLEGSMVHRWWTAPSAQFGASARVSPALLMPGMVMRIAACGAAAFGSCLLLVVLLILVPGMGAAGGEAYAKARILDQPSCPDGTPETANLLRQERQDGRIRANPWKGTACIHFTDPAGRVVRGRQVAETSTHYFLYQRARRITLREQIPSSSQSDVR